MSMQMKERRGGEEAIIEYLAMRSTLSSHCAPAVWFRTEWRHRYE